MRHTIPPSFLRKFTAGKYSGNGTDYRCKLPAGVLFRRRNRRSLLSRDISAASIEPGQAIFFTHAAAVWNRSIACGQCGQKLFLVRILGQVNQRLIVSGEERFACGFRKCIAACFKHIIINLRRTAYEQLIYFIQNFTVRKQLNFPFCNLLLDPWNRILGEPVGL